MKWSVVFGGGRMRLGGFSANMQYACSVEAPDEAAAVEAAKAKRDAADFATYTRVVSVERIYRYAFTLRSKTDRRRRETFFANGTSERDARRSLEYMPAVNRFAGAYKTLTGNIVKVEQGS